MAHARQPGREPDAPVAAQGAREQLRGRLEHQRERREHGSVDSVLSAGKVLHRLAVPAILIVASLGACLLLLELGLRLFGYDAMSELGPSGRGVILRESDNPLRG